MARSGIWISPTQFVEFDRQNLMSEVATRQRRNDFWGFTQFLPNPDPVLKKQGKDISAYREILTDAHLGGCLDTRKGNVLSLEWSIDRGKTRSRQAKVLQSVFDRLDIDRITNEVLDAPAYGYQPMEMLYEERDGWIGLRDIVGKPQEWFVFHPEDNSPRFLSRESPVNGEEVSPEKIIVVKHGATYNNPYGFPVLSRCFWPVIFKKGGLKFWVTFTEKYGMPWVSAAYPDAWLGDDDKVQKFFDEIDGMVQDALVVLPQAAKLQVTPTGGQVSVEIYQGLADAMDKEMSKAIFGHGAAADATPGRLGNEEVASSSVDAKKASDKKLVASFFNEVLRILTRINFGDTAIPPRFVHYEEEDVDLDQAERDTKLHAIGWRPTDQYFMREYDFEEGDFTLDHAKPTPPTPPTPPPAEFKEQGCCADDHAEADDDPDPLAEIESKLSPEQMQHQMEKMLKPVFSLIARSSSYTEVMEGLAEIYPTMNSADLEAVLERGIFLAETVGRLNVDGEAAEDAE